MTMDQFPSFPALKAPGVSITSSGGTTAGGSYSLQCSVSVVELLVVSPSVEWLDPDGRVASADDLTVDATAVTAGTSTTRSIAFAPLHTSHAQEYTCRAAITIESISIDDLSSSATEGVSVDSKCIAVVLL